MSFRKYGGVNYSAKNNFSKNHYTTSDNLLVTETLGQPNSDLIIQSNVIEKRPTGVFQYLYLHKGATFTGPINFTDTLTGPSGSFQSLSVGVSGATFNGPILFTNTLSGPTGYIDYLGCQYLKGGTGSFNNGLFQYLYVYRGATFTGPINFTDTLTGPSGSFQSLSVGVSGATFNGPILFTNTLSGPTGYINYLGCQYLKGVTGSFDNIVLTASEVTTLANGVVTKSYVDSLSTGIKPIGTCACATTDSIAAFTGGSNIYYVNSSYFPTTIDGVEVSYNNDNHIVLIKDQTNPIDNGVWDASYNPSTNQYYWIRDPALPAGSFATGVSVFISYGNTNRLCTFIQTQGSASNPAVTQTDSLVFTKFNSVSFTLGAGLTGINNENTGYEIMVTPEITVDTLDAGTGTFQNLSVGTGGAFFTVPIEWQPTSLSSNTYDCMAMSSSGQYILTAQSNDYDVYIYNSLESSWYYTNIGNSICNLAMSSSGQYQTVIAYYGTSQGYIYVSTDYGQNFKLVTSTTDFVGIYNSIAIVSSGELQYACTSSSIYTSSDYGSTWNLMSGAPTSTTNTFSAIGCDSTGAYLTVCDSEYIYVYNGTTWNNSYTPVGGLTATHTAISSSGQYQTISNTGGNSVCYASSNYGNNWSPVNVPNGGWNSVAMTSSGQFQSLVSLYGDFVGMYTSNNYGVTWSLYSTPVSGIYSVALSSSGYLMAIGSSEAVYLTNLLSSYINGPTGSIPYLTSISSISTTVSGGTGSFQNLSVGSGSTFTGPISFTTMTGGTGSFQSLSVGSGATFTGPISFTTMTGGTGSFQNLSVGSSAKFTGPISFTTMTGGTGSFQNLSVGSGATFTGPISFTTMTGGTGSFQNLSVGTGGAFFTVPIEWQPTSLSSNTYDCMAMSSSGQYILTAQSNDYDVYIYNSLESSWYYTNIGNSICNLAMSSSGQYQTVIAYYGTSQGYIYVSTDYGQNFKLVTSTTDFVGIYNSIAIVSSGEFQYACTSSSIYISSDYGSTWNIMSGSPTSTTTFTAIGCDSTGTYLTVCDFEYIYVNNQGTWNNPYTPPGILNASHIAISSSGQYQTISNTGGNSVCYISNNSGTSWSIINDVPAGGWNSVAMTSSGQFQSVVSLYGDFLGMYTSNNYGVTWSLYSTPVSAIYSVALSSSGYLMAIGSSEAVYLTNRLLSYINGPTGSIPYLTSISSISTTVSGGTGSFQNLSVGSGATFTGPISFTTMTGGTGSFQNLSVGSGATFTGPISFTTMTGGTGSFQNLSVGSGATFTGPISFTTMTGGTGSFQNLSVGSGATFTGPISFTTMTGGTGSFQNLSVDAGSFQNLSVDAGSFQNLSVDAGSFQNLSVGSGGVGIVFASSWQPTSLSNSGTYISIAMSSSGQYILTVSTNGIYVSNDFGASWDSIFIEFTEFVAMSASGQYQTVISTNFSTSGYINVSTDYGQSFIQNTNTFPPFTGIAMVYSGELQYACTTSSIYTSSDYGSTWNPMSGAPTSTTYSFGAIGCDSTGTYLTVCDSEYIYVYNGTTWNNPYTPPALDASADTVVSHIAISSSGQYQTISNTGGGTFCYISNDYGTSWSIINDVPAGGWNYVAISSSGQFQSVVSLYGDFVGMYTSNNYGVTWSLYSTPVSDGIYSVALSSSGYFMAIGSNQEGLYTISYSYINGPTGSIQYFSSSDITSNIVTFCNGIYITSTAGNAMQFFNQADSNGGFYFYTGSTNTNTCTIGKTGVYVGNGGGITISNTSANAGFLTLNNNTTTYAGYHTTMYNWYGDGNTYVDTYLNNYYIRYADNTGNPYLNMISVGSGGVTLCESSSGTVKIYGNLTVSSGNIQATGAANLATNIAIGDSTLASTTLTGTLNTAVGYYALNSITGTAEQNTAIGGQALNTNQSGSYNVAVGSTSLTTCTTGSNNVCIGYNAGYYITTQTYNTAIGDGAMYNSSYQAYTKSTAIGYSSYVKASYQIALGTSAEHVVIGEAYPTTGVGGYVYAVAYNATSDYRIKENVEPLDLTKYSIDHLRPVSYINKKTQKQDIGLIAHELQEDFPFLVNGEKDAEEMQSVNYLSLISLLIKEVQDLKKRVKELEEK